ncbi:MAG: phosphatase PAP2 family protein [Chloroflexota bacterium]
MAHSRVMQAKRNRVWLTIAVSSAIAFVVVALGITEGTLDPLDEQLMLAIEDTRSPSLNTLMQTVTWAGSYAAAIVAVCLAFLLWRVRGWRDSALRLAVAVGGAAAYNAPLKTLFARPRPEVIPAMASPETFSFPSGHTTIAVAFYGSLAVILWRRDCRTVPVALVMLTMIIGLSRIYLGVHYPSDVLGSLLLGTGWLYITTRIRTSGQTHGRRTQGQFRPAQGNTATETRDSTQQRASQEEHGSAHTDNRSKPSHWK